MEMAESVKCFPHGHGNLSSVPQTHGQNLGVEAHTYDPSAGRQR